MKTVLTELAILCALIIICYYNTLSGSFVFDDQVAIVKNKDVLDGTLANIFSHDFWGTDIRSNNSHKSYRPLTILSFKIDTKLSDPPEINAYIFHLSQLIAYVLVCFNIYFVLNHVCDDTKTSGFESVPFLASILFSIHPVHVEVVAGLVGRADILCTHFFCLSIFLYSSVINRSFIYFLPYIVSVTASMLCKETGITSLGFCFIIDIAHPNLWKNSRFWKVRLKRLLLLSLGAVFLLYYRMKVMDFKQPVFQKADNPMSFHESFLARVLSYNYLYFLNILLLIWPQWLCFDWSMGCIPLLESATDYRVAFVILFWLCACIFAWKVLFNKENRISRSKILSAALIVVPFLPASNLFLQVGFVIGERNLFIPSIGFCLLVAIGFNNLMKTFSRNQKIMQKIFIFICLVFILRTRERSSEWLTERSLFISALKVCPNNAKVHYNVAKVVADLGEHEIAEKAYKTAINLYPEYDQAMNNLGNLLKERRRYEEAEKWLRNSIELQDSNPAAWMNLGNVLSARNNSNEAEFCYKKALSLRANYSDCYYNLGNLYISTKNHEKALASLRQAVQINPSHALAWSNIVLLLDNMNRHVEAVEAGYEALKYLKQEHANLHFCIANALGKLQQYKKSEKHFLKAISLQPENALYYSNLGVLYHRWGKINEAVDMYKAALKKNPSLESIPKHLEKLKKKVLTK